MKNIVCVMLLATLTPVATWGCSPVREDAYEVSDPSELGENVPTTAPVARVVEVQRGHKAKRCESTCAELAYATIAVRDDSPSQSYVYSFEQLAGHAPDSIFPSGLYLGSTNGKGE